MLSQTTNTMGKMKHNAKLMTGRTRMGKWIVYVYNLTESSQGQRRTKGEG
jgi:hypothetical protein